MQNVTNAVNDMNETLQEAKAMLIQNDFETDWKWAAGSQHVIQMSHPSCDIWPRTLITSVPSD